MNVGFRVYETIPRQSPDIVAALAAGAVGNVADAMHGHGVMDSGIRQMYQPIRRVTGSAITVDLTPGDGLMIRRALELAKPGDVVVVNAHGCIERAVLGGNVCISAQGLGIAGIIVDGAIRDAGEAQKIDFPVFARALCPRSGTSDCGWGEVNVPIACGGTVVNPGDVVIADADGVVVVPREWSDELVEVLHSVETTQGRPEDISRRTAENRGALVKDGARVGHALSERNASVMPGIYEWPVSGQRSST